MRGPTSSEAFDVVTAEHRVGGDSPHAAQPLAAADRPRRLAADAPARRSWPPAGRGGAPRAPSPEDFVTIWDAARSPRRRARPPSTTSGHDDASRPTCCRAAARLEERPAEAVQDRAAPGAAPRAAPGHHPQPGEQVLRIKNVSYWSLDLSFVRRPGSARWAARATSSGTTSSILPRNLKLIKSSGTGTSVARPRLSSSNSSGIATSA